MRMVDYPLTSLGTKQKGIVQYHVWEILNTGMIHFMETFVKRIDTHWPDMSICNDWGID
jgi:hypothetical protein